MRPSFPAKAENPREAMARDEDLKKPAIRSYLTASFRTGI
jgi:hypothetical protein